MSKLILKNIRMTLDPQSIGEAIKQVQKFKGDLADGLAELARHVSEELGVSVAKMLIAQFPAINTAALHDSISGEYIGAEHKGRIFTDVEYAVLVEYGTGIVGAENPHPGINDPNWINVPGTTVDGRTYSSYDQNEHGEAGWWYPSDKGWYSPPDGGPKLAWTRGMPARPFMYNTMLEIETLVEREGGQIIAQYIP